MRRRLIQMLILVATATTAWAQGDGSKLSVTTQMFLDEQAGNISFDQTEEQIKARAKAKGVTFEEASRQAKYDRPIARPVDIDGRKFIPAFVRVTDRSAVSELEALGVEVQCEFLNGTLFTTMIPVDKLQDVADIAKVSRISVSAKRRPLTDKARQATNVDDALTLSNDAFNAGLNQKYDGTGVLLGIIDTGIDFQHIAFKDKNGNSRIKRAYVVTATYNPRTYTTTYSEEEYGDGTSNAITSSAPTTDDSSEDHGTHTSSTAGGSSVIVSGSTVTVTDDHANATYGGMAPGADLFLAGCDLSDTYLANSFQKICNYADSKGMPVVVSNSWGSQVGPHDGTGEMADIVNQYFGDSHPNHVCLFAASNDAGSNGFHVVGTASKSNPLGTVVNWNTDYGLTYYDGMLANAWTRSTGKTLACKVIVISSSGTKKAEVPVSVSGSGESSETIVSGISNYVSSGALYAYRDYVDGNGKSQIILYASELKMSSGNKLAVQFYPESGSDIVDIWSGSAYNYYTNTPSTSGYTWTDGSDDMCVSDEAMYENAISVGAYVTKNSVTDYNGTTHSLASSYPNVGDIAYFSSYATADQSPTGLAYPWICAPGATIVAGVNHYNTSGSLSYINGNSTYYDMYRVNKNTTNPYGSMEGTSMATPTAAGIVALWLQASMDENALHKNLTVNDVKQIMKETAINDAYTTTGANASHFGNGKIDALAGIKYILGTTDDPTIVPGQKTMTFSARLDDEATQTLHVSGRFLTQNVTATLTDDNGVFSVDKTSFEVTDEGADIAVSFRSAAEGTFEGTLVLASAGAASVTITLTATALDVGTASDPYLNIAKYQTIDEAGWSTTYVNTLYKYTEYEEDEVAWLTMPVYGAWVGTYYNSHPQKWIESNITSTNNTYAGVTWNANDVLQGSSSYFTASTGNGRARAMGNDSRTSTTQRTVSFYVTNVTEAKLLGMGRTGVTSDYPAALKVYECTSNSDGSITASSTATKSATSTSTSTTAAYTLTVSNLDAAKVYKVEASTYRGFMYEIGFQTPLPKKYQLGDVNHDGNVDIADAIAIINHILGLAQTGIFDEELADVDGVGGISISDVTNIINIVLK
ncbi:MAG: S8 family serine peptidase [Prevotella sp.]|nr:S8 family serine peptidase [Prevotella sp.]